MGDSEIRARVQNIDLEQVKLVRCHITICRRVIKYGKLSVLMIDRILIPNKVDLGNKVFITRLNIQVRKVKRRECNFISNLRRKRNYLGNSLDRDRKEICWWWRKEGRKVANVLGRKYINSSDFINILSLDSLYELIFKHHILSENNWFAIRSSF